MSGFQETLKFSGSPVNYGTNTPVCIIQELRYLRKRAAQRQQALKTEFELKVWLNLDQSANEHTRLNISSCVQL